MGIRYFVPKNLIVLREEAVGQIFVAVDKTRIIMYQILSLDYKRTFPYRLVILKEYDADTKVWKKPNLINNKVGIVDVFPRWFTRPTFIQCDENGE